ncbi:MAG TPA: amylo-alpha-1,6-glucosidase [Roseiflexaceae bacterium]|nr:amylo-alpha-1,6-glucosidase [Roseiflexaceae bacterium]
MIDFGREVCGDIGAAASREWLVTNGIGGYAAGTVAGTHGRRYHGLLVAALRPPLGRTLLVARLDERADYDGREYALFTDQRAGGAISPEGYQLLERFHLEGTTPVWTYALGDALLEKRVWMQRGANTTLVRYELRRAGQAAGQPLPLTLTIDALVDDRDYHGMTRAADWDTRIEELPGGLRVEPRAGGTAVFLLSDRATAAPLHEWRTGYYLAFEAERGFDPIEDHLCVGRFQATLHAGEALTLVLSTEPAPNLDGAAAYAERQRDEQALIARSPYADGPDWAQQLVLAADQCLVARPEGQTAASDLSMNGVEPAAQSEGRTVIAGYPWFSDWGRDTMIALPGLTLATGRPEDARSILRTFARFVDQGMLPNRFPDAGETPEYNTVDATLWYFEAVRAYHAATSDDATLRELFPVLREIVAWHIRGTRYGIKVDLADGLLATGQADVQLTWMDVKIGDWVVTPRTGKAVEINALWYNALCCMADFAQRLELPGERYAAGARQVRRGFERFWNEAAGCCYDVIDGPNGDDATLRPNQVIAAALTHSPLSDAQARAVVETCARTLLTSHGLRTLPPDHPSYRGRFVGDWNYRDSIYHQGTVWAWLIGPFVQAHLRVYRDPAAARMLLVPLVRHGRGAGLGSVSEVFDGDPPHTPRGCFAQAWSVAELLRAWQLTES